jgi:hypothetical protein
MKLIDFTYVSSRNEEFKKKNIRVANGIKFVVLDMSDEEAGEAKSVVYLLVHATTRHCYVGQSIKNCRARWSSGNGYKKVHQPKLRAAIDKYGWTSFECHIVAFCESRHDLDLVEVACIAAAGGHNTATVLNLAPGGRVTVDRSEPIVGVNLKTGERRDFKSSADAAEQLGIKKAGNIRQVVRGQTRSASGWWFKLADSQAEPPTKWGIGSATQKTKAVSLVRLSDREEIEFASIAEASRFIGAHTSNVTKAARLGGAVCEGYWIQYKDAKTAVPERVGRARSVYKNGKPVIAENLKTGEIRKYLSGREAAADLGVDSKNVPAACKGRIKSLGGWRLSYLDETEGE